MRRTIDRRPFQVRLAEKAFYKISRTIKRKSKSRSSTRLYGALAMASALYSAMRNTDEVRDAILTLVEAAGIKSTYRRKSLRPTRLVKALFKTAGVPIAYSSIHRYCYVLLYGRKFKLSEAALRAELNKIGRIGIERKYLNGRKRSSRRIIRKRPVTPSKKSRTKIQRR